jgi:hypothetical protein
MYQEAIDALERAAKLTGRRAPVEALLAHARAASGDTRASRSLLAEFKTRNDIAPPVFALLCLDLGDKEAAMEWLQKVDGASPLIGSLKLDPVFDSLHNDPRWAALLHRLNPTD